MAINTKLINLYNEILNEYPIELLDKIKFQEIQTCIYLLDELSQIEKYDLNNNYDYLNNEIYILFTLIEISVIFRVIR